MTGILIFFQAVCKVLNESREERLDLTRLPTLINAECSSTIEARAGISQVGDYHGSTTRFYRLPNPVFDWCPNFL